MVCTADAQLRPIELAVSFWFGGIQALDPSVPMPFNLLVLVETPARVFFVHARLAGMQGLALFVVSGHSPPCACIPALCL